MNKQELYAIDDVIYKKIQEDRKRTESENNAYFDGMEKGAEMMMKAVRDHLGSQETEGGGK